MSMTMDAKGPQLPSRRILIGAALASAAVASVPVVVQAAEPDPIFAMIYTHKKLRAEWQARYDRLDEAQFDAAKEHGHPAHGADPLARLHHRGI
jgi:hypothetical protein